MVENVSDTWLIEILKMIDDLEKYGSPVDPNKYNLPKELLMLLINGVLTCSMPVLKTRETIQNL